MDVDYKALSAILAALLAVSESLGWTDKIKDNAITQFIVNNILSIFKK